MGIITNMYRGDIHPADQIGTVPGDLRDAQARLYRYCEKLEGTLPEEWRQELDRLMDLSGEAIAAAAEAGFEDGFKLAVKIMIEILQ